MSEMLNRRQIRERTHFDDNALDRGSANCYNNSSELKKLQENMCFEAYGEHQ